MKKISLHFLTPSVETLYKKYRWEFNNFPCKVLLFFNALVQISCDVNSLTQGNYIHPVYGASCLLILIIFFKVYKRYPQSYFLQDFYILFCILFPFMMGTYMGWIQMMQNDVQNFEWYIAGFTFQMFFSYLFKFRITWYQIMFAKVSGLAFLFIFDFIMTHRVISNQAIELCVLTFTSVYLDYIQDKNDRLLWEKEFMTSRQNEALKNLLEEIPDQVMVFNADLRLRYVNKSTFQLFNASNDEQLQSILAKNIEILELNAFSDVPRDTSCEGNENTFLAKIKEILTKNSTDSQGFITFTGNICTRHSNMQNMMDRVIPKTEFDIKMKKIFWENEDGVLVFMSKVDEKNFNSRLEYVNSFLNYVLGNVSHDIYTPLNVILGLVDHAISQIQDIAIVNQLNIVRNNGEILLNLVRVMIDLFSIRKGSFLMNLSQFNFQEEARDVFEMFQGIFKEKHISFTLNEIPIVSICTDCQRLREVLIGILHKSVGILHDGKIHVGIKRNQGLKGIYNVSIELIGRTEEECLSPLSTKHKLQKSKTFSLSKKFSMDNSPNFSSSDGNIDLGVGFSMIDLLIICLSGGLDDHITVRKTDDLASKESRWLFQFKIIDVSSLEPIQIVDPFKEQQLLVLHYSKLEKKKSFSSVSSLSEFSPLHPHLEIQRYTNSNQQLISSSSGSRGVHNLYSSDHIHLWPDRRIHPFGTFNTVHSNGEITTEIESLERNQKKSVSSIIERNMPNTCMSLTNSKQQEKQNSIKDMITSFSIKRIIKQTEESSFELVQPKEKKENKKIRILNADDFPYNLMVISNFCKTHGLEVFEAKNGLEALLQAEKLYKESHVSFDFIFMDCDMPLMDGFEAATKINEFYEKNNLDQVPIVAITANVMNEELGSKIQKSGMKEILFKPLGIKKFKEILKKYTNLNLSL